MPSLWLVDGSHTIFRAYHALPHLSTRQGVPTNAVYGFTTMLLRAIREGSPTHLAVAFDEEAKAKRSEIYDGYKATRGAPPDDLMPQFPLVRQVLEAMRVPAIGFPGYEADDVIATLAKRARAQGWDVVIVSGDKDMMQLVVDGIRCYDSMYEKWYGPAEVEEKWGVPPSQVADLLALTGDKIDNIPGVPGVGEKTAAGLLKEHGTLENVLANATHVKKPKLRENLLANLDNVRRGRKLISLYDDLPLPVQLEDLERKPIAEPRARPRFTRLAFVRLGERRPAPAAPPPQRSRLDCDHRRGGAAGRRQGAGEGAVRHPHLDQRGRAVARRAARARDLPSRGVRLHSARPPPSRSRRFRRPVRAGGDQRQESDPAAQAAARGPRHHQGRARSEARRRCLAPRGRKPKGPGHRLAHRLVLDRPDGPRSLAGADRTRAHLLPAAAAEGALRAERERKEGDAARGAASGRDGCGGRRAGRRSAPPLRGIGRGPARRSRAARPLHGHREAADRGAGRSGSDRNPHRRAPAAAAGGGARPSDRRAPPADLPARRRRVPSGVHAAARRSPLQEAQPPRPEAGQDRTFHRPGSARGAGPAAPAARQGIGTPAADEVEEHVPRRPARRPGQGRPAAHHV